MPVMFRCYQCGQVLRASLAKAGKVIACPKCQAELVVPEPAERAPAVTEGAGSAEAAEVAARVVRARADEDGGPTVESPGPEALKLNLEGKVQTENGPQPDRSAFAVTLPTQEPEPAPPPPETDFPPIKIEPQPILPQPRTYRTPGPLAAGLGETTLVARPRDVTLPRAAVVGWSLFAIAALFLAFVAGLLAGHFLWVVRVVHT